MRAVESNWYRNFLFNLEKTKGRFDSAITRTTSGKKLNRLSDNPADMSYVLNLRNKIEQINQFETNINSGLSFLRSGESALNSIHSLMYQVVTLAEEGASETVEGDGRRLIADQIDEIRDTIMAFANSEIMGRYIFAGSAFDTPPFEKDPAEPVPDTILYNGNGDRVRIQADFSVQVDTNMPGSEVFGVGGFAPAGSVDIFQRLADLRDNLLNDDTTAIGNDISSMHEIISQLNDNLGQIGNRTAHLAQIEGLIKDFKTSLQSKMSQLEDADMAKAISDLSQEQIGLQSSLQAGAMINQVSLMNFLG